MLWRPGSLEVELGLAVGGETASAVEGDGVAKFLCFLVGRNRPRPSYSLAMRRLRRLSEAECYARCYGGWEDGHDRQARAAAGHAHELAVEGEALRRALRGVSSTRVTRASSPSPKQPEAPSRTSSRPDLRVLFCGINPGRVSAAAARALRKSTQRLLAAAARGAGSRRGCSSPAEQFELLDYGDRRDERGARGRRRARAISGSGDFAGAAERLERIAERAAAGRGSDSSARRRTAARSANAPSSACRSGASATRSCSCCRRRRPQTPPCHGSNGNAGSRSWPDARWACRCAAPCAAWWLIRLIASCSCASNGRTRRSGRRRVGGSRPASPTSAHWSASWRRNRGCTTSSRDRVFGRAPTGPPISPVGPGRPIASTSSAARRSSLRRSGARNSWRATSLSRASGS